jgi:hypothetical protein
LQLLELVEHEQQIAAIQVADHRAQEAGAEGELGRLLVLGAGGQIDENGVALQGVDDVVAESKEEIGDAPLLPARVLTISQPVGTMTQHDEADSSRGLGYCPLKAETRVRTPYPLQEATAHIAAAWAVVFFVPGPMFLLEASRQGSTGKRDDALVCNCSIPASWRPMIARPTPTVAGLIRDALGRAVDPVHLASWRYPNRRRDCQHGRQDGGRQRRERREERGRCCGRRGGRRAGRGAGHGRGGR